MFFNKKSSEEIEAELADLMKDAVPFGSREWGGATSGSDYDYVVDYDTASKIAALAKKGKLRYNLKVDDSYTTLPLAIERMVTFSLGGKDYQFTTPFKKQHKEFLAAVRLTSNYVKDNDIDMSTKKKRIRVFENFIQLVLNADKYSQKFNQFNYAVENYPEYLI